jgi:hypothetical protein
MLSLEGKEIDVKNRGTLLLTSSAVVNSRTSLQRMVTPQRIYARRARSRERARLRKLRGMSESQSSTSRSISWRAVWITCPERRRVCIFSHFSLFSRALSNIIAENKFGRSYWYQQHNVRTLKEYIARLGRKLGIEPCKQIKKKAEEKGIDEDKQEETLSGLEFENSMDIWDHD